MRWCWTLVAVVLAACGGGSPPAAPAAPSAPAPSGSPAVLSVSMTPNPVVEDPACVCGGLPNRVSAIGQLSVRETAGVGARIDSIRAVLRNTATGATTFTNDFTAADVAGHANGINRVAGGGTLDIVDVGGHYDRSVRGPGTMTIDVRAVDDRGNTVTASLNVPVRP